MSDWLLGVKVPPLSMTDIRRMATQIRMEVLCLAPNQRFPVMEMLEWFMPKGIPGFDWVVSDEMPSRLEACAFPDGCLENPDGPFIKVSSRVYEAACQGDGRARLTILHECGHIFLHQKVAVHHRGATGWQLKPFENSEWQANTFAAELLMPPESFQSCSSWQMYCERMQVSNQAVEVRAHKLLQRREIPHLSWLV